VRSAIAEPIDISHFKKIGFESENKLREEKIGAEKRK
jgi:hypothetical protein